MKKEKFLRIKKIANRLKRKYNAEKVILFGSCARGEDNEDSDVDLFVVASTKEKFFKRSATVLKLTRDLYKGLGLSPIVLTREELEERLKKGDPFIQIILNEGIEL